MNALVERTGTNRIDRLAPYTVGTDVLSFSISPNGHVAEKRDVSSEGKLHAFAEQLDAVMGGGLVVPVAIFDEEPDVEPYSALSDIAEGIGGVINLTTLPHEKPSYEILLHGVSDAMMDWTDALIVNGVEKNTAESYTEHFGTQVFGSIETDAGQLYKRNEDRTRLRDLYIRKRDQQEQTIWESLGVRGE